MAENRYAPPTSAVADFGSGSQPLARPRSVIYGIRMLWAQLALGIPGLAFQLITLPQDAQAIGLTYQVLNELPHANLGNAPPVLGVLMNIVGIGLLFNASSNGWYRAMAANRIGSHE